MDPTPGNPGRSTVEQAFGASFTSDIENTESLLDKVGSAFDSPAPSEDGRGLEGNKLHQSFTEGAPGEIKISSAYVSRDEALRMLQELDPGKRTSERPSQNPSKGHGADAHPHRRNHVAEMGAEAAPQAWARSAHPWDPGTQDCTGVVGLQFDERHHG